MEKKQFNIRLNASTCQQIDQLKKDSGKTMTGIIQELICDGQVKAVDKEQNRRVLQGIAELHDQCNQGNLRILGELKKTNHRIEQLERQMVVVPGNDAVKRDVMIVESQMDTLLDHVQNMQMKIEQGVKDIVNIQREK